MSHFGFSPVFDHAFLRFPLAITPVGGETGAVLHLPCGSAPTALTEYVYKGQTVTEIKVLMPGCDPLTWLVALPPEKVQEIFREWMHRINRIPGGDLSNVKSFDPS